jgi:hypothetical protein
VQRIFFATLLVGEKVGRIQRVITQILEGRAMKLLGAALRNDADLSAGAPPELRGGHAGLHGEFLHRVGDAEVTQRRVNLCIDIADAVEQEHIGLRACPGDIEAASLHTICRWHYARGY